MARSIQELDTYDYGVINRPGKKQSMLTECPGGHATNVGWLLPWKCRKDGATVVAAVSWGDDVGGLAKCQEEDLLLSLIRQALTKGQTPSEDELVGSEGAQVKAYWMQLDMRRYVLGWTWVEPDRETQWLT